MDWDIDEMKKNIVNSGLYIVEPDDLEKLAEDTIEENIERKREENKCIIK